MRSQYRKVKASNIAFIEPSAFDANCVFSEAQIFVGLLKQARRFADVADTIDAHYLPMFENSTNSYLSQAGNPQKLVFGGFVDVDGEIIGMQPCPVFLGIDFEREKATFVETDIRFGKSILSHQEVDLI